MLVVLLRVVIGSRLSVKTGQNLALGRIDWKILTINRKKNFSHTTLLRPSYGIQETPLFLAVKLSFGRTQREINYTNTLLDIPLAYTLVAGQRSFNYKGATPWNS